MTTTQPSTAGSTGARPDPEEECTVAVQALCRGRQDTNVLGVTRNAARGGREHLAIRYGRVLLYIEDLAALESLVDLVDKAEILGGRVFDEPEDAFTQAEAASRRFFERTGRLPQADRRTP